MRERSQRSPGILSSFALLPIALLFLSSQKETCFPFHANVLRGVREREREMESGQAHQDARLSLLQFAGSSVSNLDRTLTLRHRERADVVVACTDGSSVLAHSPVLRAGSVVLDDRLRGAAPTEWGEDGVPRVPMAVDVDSASLRMVLEWMYERRLPAHKVERLLIDGDHVVLRGARALAQEWGLEGLVQALEDRALHVDSVRACEALGTARPMVRAVVEKWLPAGGTARALRYAKEVQRMGGPWRDLLEVITHHIMHDRRGCREFQDILEEAIPLLDEGPLAPFRELCTELVCVAVSFCGDCFWSWTCLGRRHPLQWRWVLDTLTKGVSEDAASWFLHASSEEGGFPEAETERARGLVAQQTTITRDWFHAFMLLGVDRNHLRSAEDLRNVIFTARALWALEHTPWPLHSPVGDTDLADPDARIFMLAKYDSRVLLFMDFLAEETHQDDAGCLAKGILRSVTILCIESAKRVSSLHQARFLDGPVPCTCRFKSTVSDRLLPCLTLCARDNPETPLLRLDKESLVVRDQSDEEWHEEETCCRLCVGESLQRELDTPLPGWAALPLAEEGDKRAERMADKHELTVLALVKECEDSDSSEASEGSGPG